MSDSVLGLGMTLFNISFYHDDDDYYDDYDYDEQLISKVSCFRACLVDVSF